MVSSQNSADLIYTALNFRMFKLHLSLGHRKGDRLMLDLGETLTRAKHPKMLEGSGIKSRRMINLG